MQRQNGNDFAETHRNSAYGALLNPAFLYGSEKSGASVTATGRAITTHMLYTIEELVTGISKKYAKIKGIEKDNAEDNSWHYITQRTQLEELRRAKKIANPNQQLSPDFIDFESVKYSDTDSGYFLTGASSKQEAIETADLIAEQVNCSFPGFVRDSFNCQPDFDNFINAGREVVAVRGLFQAKKKYVLKIVDLEGFTPPPGKDIKSQGSEIKKADTPKIIQKFLEKTLDMILDGLEYDIICRFVNEQRVALLKNKDNVFLLGVAKQVNNLTKFEHEYANPGSVSNESGRRLGLPGHVRAALNYNHLLEIFEKGAKQIRSGDKVVIFYIKPNEYKFDSIAFPSEFSKFPRWFSEHFKVDIKKTESKMFDNKLQGIFDALGKDVPSPQSVLTNSIILF